MDEHQLSVFDGQTVVDDDVHPLTKLPELETEDTSEGPKDLVLVLVLVPADPRPSSVQVLVLVLYWSFSELLHLI